MNYNMNILKIKFVYSQFNNKNISKIMYFFCFGSYFFKGLICLVEINFL